MNSLESSAPRGPGADGDDAVTREGVRTRLQRLGIASLQTYGLVIAILLIGAFFQSQRSEFFTLDNFVALLRAMASLAMIAFAQLFVIISGELDLSVGSVYSLAASSLAVLWLGGGNLPFHFPFLVALLITLVMLAAIGSINAFLTTVVGIPSFIATLGMLSVASGAELWIGNAGNFTPAYNTPLPPRGELATFQSLGATQLPLNIPIQVLWLLAFFIVFWIVRHRTLFGFRLLALGGNPEASRVVRLPGRRYKFIVFIVCSVVAGFAGILDFSYVGSVAPNGGGSLTFPVFAAVVIGGASLSGGRGTVFGTLLGAILLALLQNGLALIGAGAFAQDVFVGVVTIAAVSVDRLAARIRK